MIARAVAAALLLTLLGAAPAAAQQTMTLQDAGGAPVMLLVDVSGSMGDDDGTGRVKIEGAKAALLDFLRSVEPQTPMGLRTYPAGDGGCDEGEARFDGDLIPRDPRKMAAEIRALAPAGDTPTAEAMRRAATVMERSGAGQGTLIIVSDGESTCEDPCEAAEEIAAKGIALETITVGFRISDQGRDELKCIAKAMDGEYVDADEGDALGEVFDSVSRPKLALSLRYPSRAVAEVGNDVGGTVKVDATIRNEGGQPARNVSARLRFDEGSPGTSRPLRALGNLAPGEERAVVWRFRPSVLQIGDTVRFTGLARAENGLVDAEATGAIEIVDASGPEDAGPILRRPGKLVILGDSYSAGEGAGDYLYPTDTAKNACHRSRQTYLFKEFELPDRNHLACSGAVTNDVLYANDGNDVEAQVDQLRSLTRRSETLAGVVMTMGGNDAGFAKIAYSCLARAACDTWIYDPLYNVRGTKNEDFVNARLEPLANQLITTYRAVNGVLNVKGLIRSRGGAAPIIVLAYPVPVPQSPRAGCPTTLSISPGEVAFIARFITRLNGVVEGAVRRAREQHKVPVFFVPTTEDAFLPDHTVCDRVPYARGFDRPRAAGPDWRNSLKSALLGRSKDAAMDRLARSAQQFLHPNGDGYRAESRAIVRWSQTVEARAAVDTLAKPEPGDPSIAGTWPVSDVDLGQLAPGAAPTLQGGTVHPLTLDGFAPGQTVTIELQSGVRTLGLRRADERGRLETRVAIPERVPPGDHHVVVSGMAPDGRPRIVRIPVVVARDRPPPIVRGSLLGGAGLWALALCAFGAAARARRRGGKPA